MARRTYQVTINGTRFTRTTERTYTHAVAVLRRGEWEVKNWCSSEALANTQARAIKRQSSAANVVVIGQGESITVG